MARFMIYLFPLLIDMILSTLFFVCCLRMAESGASALAVSMVCTAWALTYSITSFFSGKVVTLGNAVHFAAASCFALAVLSGLFIVIPALQLQYVFMVVSGVAIAFFFTPFQVFMKAVMGQTSCGLGASIGLYTAAWSSGLALGPFVSGYLWQSFNWQSCHLVNALLALSCAFGLYLLKNYASSTPVLTAGREPYNYSRQPDFALIGWICGGICCLVVALLRGVYPTLATTLAVSKSDQGIMFAIMFGTQAATGLALCAFRLWMYHRLPIVIMSLAGMSGLLLFALGKNATAFFAAALLVGIYSGMSSCYIVFHALVHPSRSTRNVSINEAVVGLAGIIGPMAGGWLADLSGLASPFLISALLVGVAIAIQWRAHTLRKAVR